MGSSLVSLRNFVPLRSAPNEPDSQDGARVALVRALFDGQDDLVRPYARQVEENVRMLAGQQHSVFHPTLNRWIDVTDWMTADERRWRKRPTFNRILPWYIINHARATENPPIVTFVPGPDAIDAELAEVMDTVWKAQWWEQGLDDVHDRVMAWVLVAGRANCETMIDLDGGDLRKWIGDDLVPVVDEYDQPLVHPEQGPMFGMAQNVPFGPDGRPLAKIISRSDGSTEVQHTGEPHATREGRLRTEVPSPLQIRGQWGPQPWHEKAWHGKRSYLTPEEVFERYEIEVAPDVRGGNASDAGELERLLFGTGFYGAVNDDIRIANSAGHTDGYVEVTEITWKPTTAREELAMTPENPNGGRLLAVTRSGVVLTDGPRSAPWKYTSPIRSFEFVKLPGRPGGSTPQEAMNPIQRAYNDGYARIREHVNLVSNPKAVIDIASGIKAGQFTNAPGDSYRVNRRPGVPAIEYIVPPPLSEDVYKLQQMLLQELTDLGNLHGTSGDAPSPDPSGELVKELRFNSDRFLGPTMKRTVIEYARWAEDQQAALPIVWDQEKILSYAGDDNIGRTLTVLPMMFEQGQIHVRPDTESALPEGRGERQAKIYKLWLDGGLGQPLDPATLSKFHELLHMPNLSRVAKVGGVDATTAEKENGQILQGTDPSQIPVYPWYDSAAHLQVHERYMKSDEFKHLDKQIQDAFVFHRQAHITAIQMAAQAQMQAQIAAQNVALGGASGPKESGGPGSEGAAPGGGDKNVKIGAPPLAQPQPAPPSGVAPGAMPTAPAPAPVA